MIAAILLAVSVVAMVQFAVYYWRAIMAAVAAAPVSDRVRCAAGVVDNSVGAADFGAILSLHELTPGLKGESNALRAVRAYYRVAQVLARLTDFKIPQIAAWAEREMATCSRYVAVMVDQQLERNLACAAEIRSC